MPNKIFLTDFLSYSILTIFGLQKDEKLAKLPKMRKIFSAYKRLVLRKLIQNAKFRENCKNIKKEKGKIKLTKLKKDQKRNLLPIWCSK